MAFKPKYSKSMKSRKMRAPRNVKKSNGIQTTSIITNPKLKYVVKKLISSQSETKQITSTVFPVVGANGIILGSGINNVAVPAQGMTCVLPIIPQVFQGTGEGQRIGNVINPVSLLVRGIVNALPTGTTNNNFTNQPLYVRVVVYCLRSNATINVNDGLLDQGTSFKNFDGSLQDLMLPYNLERFKILKSRTFNLQPMFDPTLTIDNTNKATSKMFKFYLPLPKKLEYADNVGDNNKTRYYMAAGVVNYDGNLLASTDARAKIWCETLLKFKDA